MSAIEPYNGADCPHCGAGIETDRGVTRCPECRALVMTVDGTVGRPWRGLDDPLPPVFVLNVREAGRGVYNARGLKWEDGGGPPDADRIKRAALYRIEDLCEAGTEGEMTPDEALLAIADAWPESVGCASIAEDIAAIKPATITLLTSGGPVTVPTGGPGVISDAPVDEGAPDPPYDWLTVGRAPDGSYTLTANRDHVVTPEESNRIRGWYYEHEQPALCARHAWVNDGAIEYREADGARLYVAEPGGPGYYVPMPAADGARRWQPGDGVPIAIAHRDLAEREPFLVNWPSGLGDVSLTEDEPAWPDGWVESQPHDIVELDGPADLQWECDGFWVAVALRGDRLVWSVSYVGDDRELALLLLLARNEAARRLL